MERAGIDWTWQEMDGMAGNSWNWLDIAGMTKNCLKWIEMLDWLELAEHG